MSTQKPPREWLIYYKSGNAKWYVDMTGDYPEMVEGEDERRIPVIELDAYDAAQAEIAKLRVEVGEMHEHGWRWESEMDKAQARIAEYEKIQCDIEDELAKARAEVERWRKMFYDESKQHEEALAEINARDAKLAVAVEALKSVVSEFEDMRDSLYISEEWHSKAREALKQIGGGE